MRKKLPAFLCALTLLAALLAGCGSSAASTASSAAETDAGHSYGTADFALDEAGGTGTAESAPAASKTVSAASGSDSARSEAKRIYTANLNMETTDFDTAAAGLEELTATFGGYVQSSDVENYGSGYRSGYYTVRVPAEKFDAFYKQAGELCHVTSRSSNVEDVSEYYYDTAGRLKTQQTKLERLQALLAKADKMEDIITLESAISDTEEQIDSLSGELSHYDALVEDATVTITLSEVYRLSNTEEPADSFASRFVTALASGWSGFVTFLENALVALAYGWVWVIALIVAAAAVITSLHRRGKRAKAVQSTPAAPEKKTEEHDKSGKEE